MNDLALEYPCAVEAIWPRAEVRRSGNQLLRSGNNPHADIRLPPHSNQIRIMAPDSMVGALFVEWDFDKWNYLLRDAFVQGHTYIPELPAGRSSEVLPPSLIHIQRFAERFIRDAWVRIHKLPEQQFDDTAIVLDRINEIQEPETLLRVLRDLADGSAILPAGLPPDSPAIAVIKRLFAINSDRGLQAVKTLIGLRNGLPFRPGYFQISLAGVLLAAIRASSPNEELATWIWSEVEYLRDRGIKELGNRSLGFAVLASFTAAGLMAESPSPTAFTRIDQELAKSLDAAPSYSERRAFLRFLADSCNQGIDSSNFYSHLAKLAIFLKYIVNDPDILRTQNQLLCLVRNIIQPALGLLVE
jgi:hypothetical protein